MHIKKIEIDGFKSYSQKQIVDKFDEQFNAITGLNGSGKSNILDSICFVLGITDLKCIRAENFNALVYKNGQSGVLKASVTITFDNTDKKTGPLGYGNYDEIIVRRQVIVNGRNSYTINGSAMTNNKVFDFFRGVGLNVNNPHFLIMQGRITKVLNMKPHEILGMVEEAAGTKMYETKRQAAVNIIEKKQSKVLEITKLMDEDILPQVEKLKQDRSNFLEYNKCERDLKLVDRKLAAYIYQASLNTADSYDSKVEKLKNKKDDCLAKIAKLEEDAVQLRSQISELEVQKKTKSETGRKALDDAVLTSQKELVTLEVARDETQDEINRLRAELEQKHKSIEADTIMLANTEKSLKKLENDLGGEEAEGNAAEETVRLCKAKLEALAKGLTTDDKGQAVTLEAQTTATRSQLSEITTDVRKAEMKKKRLVPELNLKKKEFEALKKQNTSESSELKSKEQDVRQYEEVIRRLNYDETEETALRERLPKAKNEQHQLKQKMNQIYQRDARLDFTYQDPWPNFDRDKEIHGTLATLFTVKDPKHAVAIETAAGSLLYNIVATHQKTAATLVQKKLMSQRRTFFPLDAITRRNPEGLGPRINFAKNMASQRGQTVLMAIDLIEYDQRYHDCMEWVFQGVLVVEDPQLANDLTFNPKVKLRSVTLRGDDNKPQGLVSGGAIEKRTPILEVLSPFAALKKDHQKVVYEIQQIESRLVEIEPARQKFAAAKDKLDQATGRLNEIRDNLKNSPVEILRGEITNLEKELSESEDVIKGSAQRVKELNDKIKEYEDRKKNAKSFEERERQAIHKEMEAAEKKLKSLKGKYEIAKDTLASHRAQVETLRAQIAKEQAEVAQANEELVNVTNSLTDQDTVVKETTATLAIAQAALDEFLGQLREHDDQISEIAKESQAVEKERKKLVAEIEANGRDVEKYTTDAKQLRAQAAATLKLNTWIDDEKAHFGQKGTDYDFTGFNQETGKAEMERISSKMKELDRKLNRTAMNVLQQAEEQVQNLVKKKDQIELDKKKLLETIETLDEKKKSEILKAHTQVNRDFGNIFSTLLPGTSAKLDPPEGKTALDGLEVKVAFNGKWKESLNELSGGQRSLVALSLVLAMLKFKPAPIYILDEVDSALDLSHTQNIGHMIKKHFTNSQFIIVSLKEGMFNHANVLYRTKFVDGTSQVTRTENRD